MSVIMDNTRHLDDIFEGHQRQIIEKSRIDTLSLNNDPQTAEGSSLATQEIGGLNDIICTLSASSRSKPLERDVLMKSITRIFSLRVERYTESSDVSSIRISELTSLAAAKAAVRTLELVMHNLLEQTLALNGEIRYWNSILGSSGYAALYTVQTYPLRIWHKTKNIYADWRNSDISTQSSISHISSRWVRFYNLIQNSTCPPSTCSLWNRALSPWFSWSEARQNQKSLKIAKNTYTSSIGILMEQLFPFNLDDDDVVHGDACNTSTEEWRSLISRCTILLETILQNTNMRETSAPDFEDAILGTIGRTFDTAHSHVNRQSQIRESIHVLDRLVHVLQEFLPNHAASSVDIVRKHGRPSRLVRYWLPFAVTVFSGSISLKVLASRRAELFQWTSDIASTAMDFWNNWVVKRIKKLIGTIRHDENSEIAIMSKNSLEADRSSLERMVVDFVTDRFDSRRNQLTGSDAETITSKVKEGDLTPVLRSYERDLRGPLVGTIRGDLVRAFLIQIQKTKVDIEIAISGIDALLKSQELVFGIVSLTPGILVSYAFCRWIWGLFDVRKGLHIGRKQDELRRALRNTNRILTSTSPTAQGRLRYKDHGMLVCETELLLRRAKIGLKRSQYCELQEDIKDLMNIQYGIDRQLKVVERMRWSHISGCYR